LPVRRASWTHSCAASDSFHFDSVDPQWAAPAPVGGVAFPPAADSDNIGVGGDDRAEDLDAIVAAARDSGADEFLAALPVAYETMLGRQFEGGEELSIGQWQRVALARAFFRGAPFVILDEPTAALDPRAEHELFERIRTMASGRTVLLISHRFSSVRSADRIFVLRGGRLVEQGTHDELLAEGGQYAELFSMQAAAYLSPAVEA
jgi:ATP-binding cassette, subfamily B, bacterial